jgi:hypothetical protein
MNLPRSAVVALLLLLPPSGLALPPDEVAPAARLDCFPGAIYRKAVSSLDTWTGIEAVITLPTLVTDPQRVDEKTGKPLDNASCYIGGNADPDAGSTEIDAGVNWEVIREADGRVSPQRKAFRPFWRNKQWFNAPARPELYFHPGDTVRLSIWTAAQDRLTFRVELLARAGEPPAASPISVHEAEMDAPGFGPGRKQQFKRVSAIDQMRNEGKPAQPTTARVEGAIWSRVSLMRGEERRLMTRERFTDMRCPDTRLVEARATDDPSGEKIELRGG